VVAAADEKTMIMCKKRFEIEDNPRMALSRENYLILAAGFAVIVLGFILMSGGGSESPDEFDYAMFSWRRITLAPILVLLGFGIEAYGIMKRPRNPEK